MMKWGEKQLHSELSFLFFFFLIRVWKIWLQFPETWFMDEQRTVNSEQELVRPNAEGKICT